MSRKNNLGCVKWFIRCLLFSNLGLPDKRLYPSISAVYGNTEVSMVYLGPPMDGWEQQDRFQAAAFLKVSPESLTKSSASIIIYYILNFEYGTLLYIILSKESIYFVSIAASNFLSKVQKLRIQIQRLFVFKWAQLLCEKIEFMFVPTKIEHWILVFH